MITEAKMLALTAELARVKSRQDTAAALDIYHPDIELVSPGFDAISHGRAEAAKSLTLFFTLFPDYRVTLIHHACNGPMMLASGEATLTPAIPGDPCQSVTVPVFIEFHFRDKHISKETFSLDLGLICKKAGIAPHQWTTAVSNALLSTTVKEL